MTTAMWVWRRKILLLALCLALTPGYASSGAKRLQMPDRLRGDLNQVLKCADDFHTASVSLDHKKEARALKELIKKLDQARANSRMAKHNQAHVSKILDSARKNLENARMAAGDARRNSLREGFREIVQLARTIQLDSYNIFFCPSDKAVWIQKSSRPANPFEPKKLKSCGKMVR